MKCQDSSNPSFLTIRRFASSPPFRFTIGADQKQFYLQSALVASLSAPLSRLVNNDNFQESREAHVVLDHVDEETFAYFVEYAYTGDYRAPVPPVAAAGRTPTASTTSGLFEPGGLFGGPAANSNAHNASVVTQASTSTAPSALGHRPTVRPLFDTSTSTSTTSYANAPLTSTTPRFGTEPAPTGGGLFRTPANPSTNSSNAPTQTSRSGGLFAIMQTSVNNANTPAPTTTSLFGNTPSVAAHPTSVLAAASTARAPTLGPHAISGYETLWATLTDSFKGSDLTKVTPPATQPTSSPDVIVNTLVVHTRLYLFADYYDVIPLSGTAYRRMGNTLLKYYGDPKTFTKPWQMRHVVELVELCWEDDRPAKLRDDVLLYVACRMEYLWEDERFRKLVAERGDLALDLIATVAKRLK